MRSRPQGRPDRNWLAVATKRRAKLCFLSWKWRWESVFILFFNAWDCVRGDLQPQTETDGSSPVQFISRGDVTAHMADQIRLFTCFTCRRRNNSNTCLPSFTLCFIWPFYFSGVVSWDQNLLGESASKWQHNYVSETTHKVSKIKRSQGWAGYQEIKIKPLK